MESPKSSRQLGPPPLGRMLTIHADGAPQSRPRWARPRSLRHPTNQDGSAERTLEADGGWDVQGGFRSTCCRRATELPSGWCATSTMDGWKSRLKAHLRNELRLWCERGPSSATVRKVRLSYLPVTEILVRNQARADRRCTRQLWLLRHGATEWALNGRHTGSTDLPPLPEGETEAKGLAPVLSQHSFAAVFSSPLQRARRTCELGGLGDQVVVVDALQEWNYGDYEGITTAEIQREVPDWSIWTIDARTGKTQQRFNNAAPGDRPRHGRDRARGYGPLCPWPPAASPHRHLARPWRAGRRAVQAEHRFDLRAGP